MPVGTRIRGNNAFGITTDNPLAIGATTLNSSQLGTLPAVSGNHAVITLDPLRINGEPEIVVVTAHGAGATSATILRGQYGTTARAHGVGTQWVHAPLTEDVTVIVTSGTRPGNPYEGQMIFETDTDRTLNWNGTNWTQHRIGIEPDQFFAGGLANGTATTFTDFLTQNTILALPYPYTMIVEAFLVHGANGVINGVTWQVRDEAGVSINFKGAVFHAQDSWDAQHDTVNTNRISTILGKKDYGAGATCGFRLAYKVNTSNVFADVGVRVSFMPRP